MLILLTLRGGLPLWLISFSGVHNLGPLYFCCKVLIKSPPYVLGVVQVRMLVSTELTVST